MNILRPQRGISRFFTAEEIPRWFGLSVIVGFVIGVGGLIYFGGRSVKRQAAEEIGFTVQACLRTIVGQLARLNWSDDGERYAVFEEATATAVGSHGPFRLLRVVDEDRSILLSTEPAEVGGGSPSAKDHRAGEFAVVRIPFCAKMPQARESPTESQRIFADAPVTSGADGTQSCTTLYAEAVPNPSLATLGADNQWSSLALWFTIPMLAFLVFHHLLRNEFRGVSRVRDRLRLRCERIEQELASLRIVDAVDGVTAAWNEIIESSQEWLQAVQRSEADNELSRVLQRSSGGALAEALHAIPDGILLITNEVSFEYLNSAVFRLFGWTPEQPKEHTLADIKANAVGSAALDVVRRALQPTGSYEPCDQLLEIPAETGQGASSYRVTVTPLRRARLDGACLVTIRDVSQQIRADRAREDFVTQVTHELRTPLTNIRAYAETLSSGMFDDPKMITDCYNVITKETRRLSRLIEDILNMSQLEVGSIQLRAEEVNLRTLLSDGVRDVRGLADDKNIDVQLLLPAKMEPVQGDRDKLAVVLNNLLGNAIKYTPRNGNVVVACQYSATEVLITVKDNGIGIDATEHAKVFEKFQRGSDPAVQKESGTGIGLYTAREIVRRHGGEIQVVSEKGQGATFMVRLPHELSRAGALSTAKGT